MIIRYRRNLKSKILTFNYTDLLYIHRRRRSKDRANRIIELRIGVYCDRNRHWNHAVSPFGLTLLAGFYIFGSCAMNVLSRYIAFAKVSNSMECEAWRSKSSSCSSSSSNLDEEIILPRHFSRPFLFSRIDPKRLAIGKQREDKISIVSNATPPPNLGSSKR